MVSSPIPPGSVGYCAVIVPKYDFWQGFFILEAHERLHRRVLADARIAFADAGSATTVEIAMGASGSADQPLIGALAASLVEVVVAGQEQKVVALSGALRLLIGDYFWIEGIRGAAGTRTVVHRMMDITNPEAARHFINRLPQVTAMKSNVSAQMKNRGRLS